MLSYYFVWCVFIQNYFINYIYICINYMYGVFKKYLSGYEHHYLNTSTKFLCFFRWRLTDLYCCIWCIVVGNYHSSHNFWNILNACTHTHTHTHTHHICPIVVLCFFQCHFSNYYLSNPVFSHHIPRILLAPGSLSSENELLRGKITKKYF